jgi:GTP cyclohydrolase I
VRTRHHIVIRSTCPVDHTSDQYDAYVYVNSQVLACEEVAAAVEALTQEPVFQERLTQDLADRLGCRVKTKGRHVAGGIETTCVCEPRAVARR